MHDPHDVIVKAGLTADQYLWVRDTAETMGLSISAYLRFLVQKERRSEALNQLSTSDIEISSTKSGQ